MTYTKQEIEEAVKDAQNNGIGGLMTKESLNILVGIAQSLLDGKIGELPKPQEVMGREEVYKIVYDILRPSCVESICSKSCPGYETDCGVRKEANVIADALANKIPKPREVGEEDIYNVLITELPISKYLSIPSHKLREVAKKIAALNKELHDKKGEK